MGAIRKILLWVRICRPQTLFASLVPVLVAALSVEPNYLKMAPLLCTALCALSLQILSNLINDYYDYVRGTDKAGRIGFRRALAEGEVSKKSMLVACLTAGGIACLLGLYLVYIGGWVILAIGVSALLFAWLYTATNHSLSYLGIADIFVFLYYGVVATCGTVYILYSYAEFEPSTGNLHSPLLKSFFAGGVSGLISMCVLMINNLRDMDNDSRAGKKTFPVRFGKHAGKALMLTYVLLMPVFAWLAWGVSLSLLILIPSFILWLKVIRAKGVQYNKCLLMAGLLNLMYFLMILL